jgi:hypothetical protein
MSQGTVVTTMAGATLAITDTIPATFDSTGYGGSNQIYTAVGEVENYGNHGVTATIVEFTPVDTATVAKMKGSKNYGNMSMMIGCVPGNAGQIIMKAASESNNHYSVKLTYPLKTNEVTPEIHYLDVIVGKWENQDGAVNDVRKMACEMAVCRAPVIVNAT